MPHVLVVADADWVRNDVHAALSLPGYRLTDHAEPTTVAALVASIGPDAAVVDLQVGSMGGMAITRAIRAAAATDGAPDVPVLLLLDRAADAFLARRAGAAAWLRKPFTAPELRTAIDAALAATAAPASLDEAPAGGAEAEARS